MSRPEIAQVSDLDAALCRIDAEPLEAVKSREASAFDRLAAPFSHRLILFGAGPLGKSALAGLRRSGVEPLAFSDNNRLLWGKEINGLKVLPPDEAKVLHGDSGCFVVTIYNGSAARQQLAVLGCKAVAPFTPLFWKYAQVFIPDSCVELPHSLRGGPEEIRKCNSILQDEASRDELRGQLNWRYWLDYDGLAPALDARNTYFPLDLVSPRDDEVFVDCGSFDGVTISSFAELWCNRFRHTIAFEPDPDNRRALATNAAALGLETRMTVIPYVLGDKNGPISFTFTGSVTSHVGAAENSTTAQCRRLDDIEWPIAPTYVKMDIEGAEPMALRGAVETVRRYQPVLAICTYHRGQHLWQIPNLIHSINPEYRIFLRRYAEECWEGVCYAIPPHRLKHAEN